MPIEDTKKFIEELRALMNKYHVEIEEYTQYDGEERYCGSEWYFEGKDYGEPKNISVSISGLKKKG
jgi:hypothetical protein